MEISGTDWKWPSQNDELWYEKIDVLENIDSPVKKNSRGVYVVKEMSKYALFL